MDEEDEGEEEREDKGVAGSEGVDECTASYSCFTDLKWLISALAVLGPIPFTPGMLSCVAKCERGAMRVCLKKV